MRKNILLPAIFSLLICLPILDNIFEISPVKFLFEKKKPLEKPNFPKNSEEFANFPKKIEAFFDDNYGFRKSLIMANGWVMDKIFNESPDERAVIGKDDWLYFDNKNSFLNAQGLEKISNDKIEKATNSFIKNWQKMKAKNIKYLLVIAADKTTIYPEFLPDYIKVTFQNQRIDKFLAALKKKSPNFPVLDLRKTMKKAKKIEQVYYKTDTHWNLAGAHYGYVEIMKKLQQKYNPRQNFKKIRDRFYKGDISHIMGINKIEKKYILKEKFKKTFKRLKIDKTAKKFHKPRFFENSNQKLPILFVYKDSFFDNMLGYFAQNFSKSYFINEFPCDLDVNLLKKYNPDIVIQEFWENRIEDIANQCK